MSSEPRPNSFYGISKLRGEAHFRRLQSQNRTVHIVRAGNVYGANPCVRFEAVINRFTFEARFSRLVQIHRSGDRTRAFISVGRLADLLAATSPMLAAGTDNFVDHNRSISDIALELKSFEPELEMLFVDQDVRMNRVEVECSAEMLSLVGDPVIRW